jgi:ribonuclease P protein component
VSRKVGNAVVRNRVRRRLREALRQLPIRPGFDVVIVARPSIAVLDFAGIRGALTETAGRGRLLDVGCA